MLLERHCMALVNTKILFLGTDTSHIDTDNHVLKTREGPQWKHQWCISAQSVELTPTVFTFSWKQFLKVFIQHYAVFQLCIWSCLLWSHNKIMWSKSGTSGKELTTRLVHIDTYILRQPRHLLLFAAFKLFSLFDQFAAFYRGIVLHKSFFSSSF